MLLFFFLCAFNSLLASTEFSDLIIIKLKIDLERQIRAFQSLSKLIFIQKINILNGILLFRFLNNSTDIYRSAFFEALKINPMVEWCYRDIVIQRSKRDFSYLTIEDPEFVNMWYMLNTGQSSGPAGVDLNVIPVWKEGITGKGVVITVVDDGVDYSHPDLIDNYDPMASYDFNDNDSDPSPRDSDPDNCHGTRVAGEISASKNNFCGIGVAFNSKIGGIRMLDGTATDSLEAAALAYKNNYIDIYVNCWGPKDDGKTYGKPGPLATQALKDGAEKGRNGFGTIYVWATGNGGLTDDDCNCDGYTTSIYTISIGCISDHGLSAYYTERCSSTLAVTFNGASHREGAENQMITTDLYHRCTKQFKGTSSSAPLAAGAIALMLEQNPRLGWRDIQHIIVKSSFVTSPLDEGWRINAAGLRFNHKFGFGRIDVDAMVQKAKKWSNISPQKECLVHSCIEKINIPKRKNITIEFMSTSCKDAKNEITKLEHVVLIVSFLHKRRGDLSIDLVSPSGTLSQMLSKRLYDSSDEGLDDWKFMSVHFWDENPFGSWKVIIDDGANHKKSTMDMDTEDFAHNLIDSSIEDQKPIWDQMRKQDPHFDLPYPEGIKKDEQTGDLFNNRLYETLLKNKRAKIPFVAWSKIKPHFSKKSVYEYAKYKRNSIDSVLVEETGSQRVLVSNGFDNSGFECLNNDDCSGILLKWSVIFYGT